MKSDGKYEEMKTNSKQFIRWHRRRYRERIWFLSPEGWLVLSFILLTLGTSLLNAYYFVSDGSESDREIVFKLGAFLLFIGWASFVFLIETVKSRNGKQASFRDPNPPFVGVSIPPSPQPEWLSAMLLPEIDREWVLVEAEPWFEPGWIAHPPITVIADKDGEDSQLSASKKRNRKKKNNNQNSEFDVSEQSNENSGQIEDQITIVEQPKGSNRDLQENEQPPTSRRVDPNKKNNHAASDGDMPKESIQVSDHPKDSHETFSHPKDSHPTSGQLKDSHEISGHSKDSCPISGHSKDSQTSGGVLPEKPNQTPVQTTISNPISSGDMPEHSKQPFTHPKVSNQASVGDNPEQSNTTSIQFKDSHQIYSDKPEQSVQTSDQPKESNKTSGIIQPVGSNLVYNLDSQLSTSKKKNRRRKKYWATTSP